MISKVSISPRACSHSETFTTATTLLRVGVMEGETTADHCVRVIQFETVQEQQGLGVHHAADVLLVLDDGVRFLDLRGPHDVHDIGHAGTPSFTHPHTHTKGLGLGQILFAFEVLELVKGGWCKGYDWSSRRGRLGLFLSELGVGAPRVCRSRRGRRRREEQPLREEQDAPRQRPPHLETLPNK